MGDHPQYGGQAVIEGVMMRSPRFFAVACRRENKETVVQTESVESILRKFQWLNKPFLRGTLALIDAVVLGIKSLMFSANIAMEDIDKANADLSKEVEPAESADTGAQKRQTINDITIGATMVLGLALGIAVFIVTPHLLTDLLRRSIKNSILLNLCEGFVRIGMFVAYVALISLMKDIRRVFQYHGAEHKVINTFEAGLDLTSDNIAKCRTIHPRCGTTFILLVFVLSILVFSCLGWADAWHVRIASRLALLPVVAGIGYEIIRFAGGHKDSRLLQVILAPGLLLQKLTTREPSDDMVEVALKALQSVLELEKEQTAQPAVA